MFSSRIGLFFVLLYLTSLVALAGEPKIEVSAITELTSDAVAPIILELDFDGVSGQGAHKTSKFFAVTSEFERGMVDEEGKVGMPALNIVVTPISREMVHRKTPGDHESTFSREMLKMQFRREANIGLAGSFSIYPIGGLWEGQSRLSKAKELERFTKFYELAVDLVGLGFLGTVEGGYLPNVQVGNVVFDAGLRWDLTQRIDVRVSLGGEAHGGIGAYQKGGKTQAAFGALSAFTAQVAIGVKAMGIHFAAFAEAEYQRFDVFGHLDNPGTAETLIRFGLKGAW